MEVGTEISQKIRSAIKAKLMEIGSYVDDELPDYIMVMVANKRSQSQMADDLSLFLGANTEIFTTWLHGLLEKLQTVSSDSRKSDKSRDKKRDKKSNEAGVESKRGKRKVTKTGDTDAPKAKSSRTSCTDKNQTQSMTNTSVQDTAKEENQASIQDSQNKIVSEDRDARIIDDVEDVRGLLVTESPTDDLAKELETTETEASIEKLASSNLSEENTSSLKPSECNVVNEIERISSYQEAKDNAASFVKKRKCPSSVVAAVRLDDQDSTPAVASVVRVTERKSSVPNSMQANRTLLVKAMSEAERSIAVQRKIAVTKPLSHEDPPSEIYTPKRRKPDSTSSKVNPPPYIPSKKEATSQRLRSSSHDKEQYSTSRGSLREDFKEKEFSRTPLDDRGHRELISRSRRNELFKKLGIPCKETSLNDRERRVPDHDKEETSKSLGRDKPDLRNFKITAHISPSARLSETAKERLAKALQDKDHSLKVTLLPSVANQRGSATSRLGKVVLRQKSSDDQGDKIEEDFPGKVKMSLTSRSQRLALSLLGKEVVKRQCEAAVLSVKSNMPRRWELGRSQDSRVVEGHSSSSEAEEEPVLPVTKSLSDPTAGTVPYASHSVMSDGDSAEKDSEDLDDMLKDDLEIDLLPNTLADEFTLDLDEEEDSIKVMDPLDAVPLGEKAEGGSGTRFIVTLDGVDERQFDSNRERTYADLQPTKEGISDPSSSSKRDHFLPKPTSQTPGTFLPPQDPAYTSVSVLKSAPPKIQPFSISLKDSDDEFEDKTETKGTFSKMIGGRNTVLPTLSVNPTFESAAERMSSFQRAKISERCKFWPACAAGAECEFHHPSSLCKTFPNCKFGDKCLFIHPNCKFDSKCTRIDCPFTHSSRRLALSAAPAQFKTPLVPPDQSFFPQYTQPSSMVCRYYPNCQNVNCQFLHPKPCRFGLLCQNAGCPFSHPSAPSKDKLKWLANTSQSLRGKDGAIALTAPSSSNDTTPSKPHSATYPQALATSASVSSTSI